MKTTPRLKKILAVALAMAFALLAAAPAAGDGAYRPAHPRVGHVQPVHQPGYYRPGYYRPGHWGGPRVGVGVYFGPGFWYPPYPYNYPAYTYPAYPYVPPVVVAPSGPATYVEKGIPDEPAQAAHWYYCREPNAYYPYVRECPGGWEKVAPVPPPER